MTHIRNPKVAWAVALSLLIVAGLLAPTTVQSRQYVPDGSGGYVEQPCTLRTMAWSALLWYAGCDLLYTYEDGLAIPGNWPVAGAHEVYEALGIPIY
jgi:hypothetical protein